MGELQWALLIVCVVLVVALYVLSRRAKSEDGDDSTEDALLRGADEQGDQLDLLAPRKPPQGYDEYGVGRPRKRGGEPSMDAPKAREPASPPSVATLLKPSTQTAPAAAAVPARPVALIVAPTEEIDILGPQLHQALAMQGLRFGEGELYHRLIGGRSVFSVASLLKPGKLVPTEAETFSTKGLLVLMNLPGPVSPTVAFDDMLGTTRALAVALKADIFDASRQRVDDAVASSLRQDLQAWAKTHQLG
ncbi:cell division protein ZipA C-terminal FtsZ-binding domain-containing protein [Panacagrimonas sp.]|uniref:cell division protein ZipA C-terminal FtsZ-binding domain-containing protein n=1 Tax=Panacagrimonas sp. TaxID=2480088 RepID=UPI003B51CE8C